MKLKLFVWNEFMPDYSDGLAFAIAKDMPEAQNMIIGELGYNPSDWGPVIIKSLDEKIAFACPGGS
jgi:hypothetical protein